MSPYGTMLPSPPSTRLTAIIAHVDHGKTTLADSLIASNRIISERHAGSLRYLDDHPEERRRGITMRASGIGLTFTPLPRPNVSPSSMVIHLRDSPGHVDFGMEVTSSLLLADSAILLVDAVEGPCARTHSLVREAHSHGLIPILVINKIDRLWGEMGLSAEEAYGRVREVVEGVNAICAVVCSMVSWEGDGGGELGKEEQHGDNDQDHWNFEPAKGNVVFASALHGWGFDLSTLARSLFRTGTVPIKPPMLRQYLFGDYRYDWETKKVMKWTRGGKGEPMFAEFALGPLWNVYEGVATAVSSSSSSSSLGRQSNSSNAGGKIDASTTGIDIVLSSIQSGSTSPSVFDVQIDDDQRLPCNASEMQQLLSRIGASSEASLVSAILRRYRPLSDAVLGAVCDIGPSPNEASSKYRTRALALRDPRSIPDDVRDNFAMIQNAVLTCDASESAPTVAHVCKFASVPRSYVTDIDRTDSGSKDDNFIIGIARVLSGTLRTEDVEYYAFGPKYEWGDDDGVVTKRRIRCYLLMGSSFVRVKSVPAGHVCAVYNLEELRMKSVTLCDRRECMPLRGFDFGLQPLVKVNVEPELASDMDALERGLLKLSMADPSVEVTTTEKGERILACLGEIHLESCILDLETVYCDHHIKLRISDPIVSFCETTAWFRNEEEFDSFLEDNIAPLRQSTIPPYCDEEGLANARNGRCRAMVSGRGAAISVRVVPLPRSVYECLKSKSIVDGSEDDLAAIGKALKCSADESLLSSQFVFDALSKSLDSIDSNGNALFECAALSNGVSVKAVHSSNGEVYRKYAPTENNNREDNSETTPSSSEGYHEYQTVQHYIRNGLLGEPTTTVNISESHNDGDSTALKKWRHDMRGSALAGFRLAMRAGPLCEEPVRGVAVILESVEVAVAKKANGDGYISAKDITGGMVVAALRSGIRCALITRPARLVESHLRLTLHSSLAGLGPLHAVLSKRRGKVITDTMVDGTDLIQITATIPQAESFGLAPELLKKSSGEVTAPELVFSHWEVLDQDPFWIPTTEEEREDFGEILTSGDLSTGIDNNALKYIRMVRSRKGLLVDSSKIIIAAEKQRTLSRKK